MRSCSLECVRAHKAAASCTGVRDRLAFVPLSQFSDATLLSGACKMHLLLTLAALLLQGNSHHLAEASFILSCGSLPLLTLCCVCCVCCACCSAPITDYRWLEEVSRADDNARRHRPPVARRELPPPLAALVHAARLRGVRLLIMPPGVCVPSPVSMLFARADNIITRMM